MKQCCESQHESRVEGEYHVALIGNPNTGKSQIFTALTGLNQTIANFAGITVGYKLGNLNGSDNSVNIADLPGIYGFYAIKSEETAAIEYLHTNSQHLILNIIDGTKLNRDLLLTRQLLKHYPREQVLVVINFADKIKEREIRLDTIALEQVLGAQVILISAFQSNDIKCLKVAIQEKLQSTLTPENVYVDNQIDILRELEDDYQWVQNQTKGLYQLNEDSNYSKLVNRVDTLLLHQFWGLLIFIGVMFSLFFLTYALTVPISDFFEGKATDFGNFASSRISNPIIQSLITDWLVGGIGFILVFIPQIAALMLFLGFLEQSGYTTRVAFVMNRLLAHIGISGTSLVPMLMGFGCNVPAIIATKTISDPKERTAIVLANPFLSCSARLPVYVLITSAIFPETAPYVITSLYFGGIIVAVLLIYVLRKFAFNGELNEMLIELPDLSIPHFRSVIIQTMVQVKRFIFNAATWMALGLLGVWVLTITGPQGYVGTASGITDSWIYVIGRLLGPVFAPFGWDNRLVVALIFGFVAKEIIVATFAMIFATGSDLGLLKITLQSVFSPVSALVFLVFVLLYTPCIGTFFTIKQELGAKWAWISVAISISVAYALSIMVFYVGGFIL